jgi:hypothetical protein
MKTEDYYRVFSHAWKFFRHWLEHDKLTPDDWDTIVKDANMAVGAYRGKQIEQFAVGMYCTVISELERAKGGAR